MVDLTTNIKYLKGVGPKRAQLLNRLGIENVYDLLCHFPKRYLDRSQIIPIRKGRVGETVTVLGRVERMSLRNTRRGRSIFSLTIADETGLVECVWFNQPWLEKTFRRGEWVLTSGKLDFYRGKTITHPDFEVMSDKEEEDLIHTGRIVPVYPLTESLNQKMVRRLVKTGLDTCLDQLPESLPPRLREKRELLSVKETFQNIHFPESYSLRDLARNTLVYEEFFYLQLLLAVRKNRFRRNPGISFRVDVDLPGRLLQSLNITMTRAQERCMAEITHDMAEKVPMNRLLHGEVGSGKTLMATCASLIAIENGYQAAVMAPTEILANQHHERMTSRLTPLGIQVALLVGGMKKQEKSDVLLRLEKGEIDLAIGTHALIEEDVKFKALGLVVVDEQHRFGVMQRASLRKKGLFPDFLVMTATPIPRTLALTVYGDLDVSYLDELPQGKRDVTTKLTKEGNRDKVYEFLKTKMVDGSQVFIIYPLVEESDKIELKAATEMYEELKDQIFPQFRVGLIHGRMRGDEKEEVMREFRDGKLQILVSTTVIEVGIDIPTADIMLIEHAERYGLAQLHQLRGRIGRSGKKAYCILLPSDSVGSEAKDRLRTLEESDDGFEISEADLRLRGPGEIYGTRQHGLPELRIGDPLHDQWLLKLAREDAFKTIAHDPTLSSHENRVITMSLRRRRETVWTELASVG
jgi:ATP-dependent DNA helicase RecG